MNKIVEGMKEAVEAAKDPLWAFVAESNAIEGIFRVTAREVDATRKFLEADSLTLEALCELQAAYAPDMPIRDRVGMNVRVGGYVAPGGGRNILVELYSQIAKINKAKPGRPDSPWRRHIEFELLHPFMDGNGRTGRALWAWHMQRLGMEPFNLPFLHRFYYQTLAAQ